MIALIEVEISVQQTTAQILTMLWNRYNLFTHNLR